MLPHDLPPWRIVFHYLRPWRLDSTWQLRHDRLRGDVGGAVGKPRQPRSGGIESQSVKTPETGGTAATMLASRSTGANAISSSRPAGCSSAWSAPLPVGKTPTEPCGGWTSCGTGLPVCGCCGPTRPIAETWAQGVGDDAPGGTFAWSSSHRLRAPQAFSSSPNSG
jgi:hypothetical protein